ncbi:MAG TPA: MFS transporter [Chloroflexi bacterium]|nr:MFS transporter [Chloroflexota bacterium]
MSQRTLRLSLYATVYFVEGAVLTFFSAFNVLYLRSFALSYSLIGIVGGITLIPFILKIFIGLLSDRVSLLRLGHRKPYIVLGLALQSVAFVLLPSISPAEHFSLYLTAMILASLGMSTYDTTTDGLSIDATPPPDRGLVQGLMVGGRAFSAVVMAALMGLLAEQGQWALIFYLVAVLGLLTLLLSLFVYEDPTRSPETQFSRAAFGAFKDKAFLLFLVLGLIYPLGLYSAQSMVGAFLNEGFGIALATVGLYTAVFGIGAIAGSLVGGPLMRRVGERTSIVAALLITAAVTYGLAITPGAGLMWGMVFLFGVAFGYYETVYLAVGMDFADPRIAAFMFAFIMAVGNIGIGLGQPLAGLLVDAVGFQMMFAVFATVHLLVLPIVFAIFRLRQPVLQEA